ncbi:MAG: class I SAM-dependent methyltransferase [Saprospiraceae bacterium]|nr:class I SAM-dependent methyltransferase [Saprospiraceae bacterium]
MKAWIKTQTVDRYLQALRQQMLAELPNNISLLEIGCGTGDFLFRCAGKLSHGLGVDADIRLIQHALPDDLPHYDSSPAHRRCI